MWPLGSYDRLVQEVKYRQNNNVPLTFGILIVDYRQRENREYILNYINRFNQESSTYINFYLPGYLDEGHYGNKNIIGIDDKPFYFNEGLYFEFLEKLQRDFKIDYPYTPVLLLIEYEKGNFAESKKMVIELDSNEANIKKTGYLIEKITSIAKKRNKLDSISNHLALDMLKSGIMDDIVAIVGNPAISTIYQKGKDIAKYRVR